MKNQLKIETLYSQIENCERTPEEKYPKWNDSEDTEINKTSASPNFMS